MSITKEEVVDSPDIHFEPIVSLPPPIKVVLEENEEEILKMRAKLYRYDTTEEPNQWKERGTGEVKILKHLQDGSCRLLMRRDKTMKICSNHRILPSMQLKPNCGSDRAWVWSTPSDFADEESKPELFAIKFANSENAQKFKKAFEEAQDIVNSSLKEEQRNSENIDRVNLENLSNGTQSDKDESEDRVKSEDTSAGSKHTEKEPENLSKKKECENSSTDSELTDKLKTLSVGSTADSKTAVEVVSEQA